MAKLDKNNTTELFQWVFRVGIGFILMSALLFLLGFATDHWHKDSEINYGLWVSCQRGRCTNLIFDRLPDYHIATQVLQILATVAYTLAPVIHLTLYCMKKEEKSNGCRTRIFDAGYSIGTVFHFVSVIVFGLLHQLPESLSWSYNMSAAAVGLGVTGVILTIISRKIALRVFHFPSIIKRKHNRVGILASCSASSSRPETPLSGTSRSTKVFGPQEAHSFKFPVTNNMNMNTSLAITASSQVPYESYRSGSDKHPHRAQTHSIHKSSGSDILQLQRAASTLISKSEVLAPLRVPLRTMPYSQIFQKGL